MRGQIIILENDGWRRRSIRFVLKQTGSKVKDKALSPVTHYDYRFSYSLFT